MNRDDGRRQRGEATRGAILDAALQIIASDGLAGLTAGALAARAGVSKATVFHHFPRLQEVSGAVLDRLVAELMALSRAEGASATDYLLGLGLNSLQVLQERPEWIAACQAFMVGGLHDPQLRSRMVELSVSARAEVAADLLRLAPDTPEAAAIEIADAAVASLDGLGLHLMLTQEEDRFCEAWRALAHRMAEGLIERRPLQRAAQPG